MQIRTGPHSLPIRSWYCSVRSRLALSTERLITLNLTSRGRTFSTSSSQREVIQAQGQTGSNHISTAARSVMVEYCTRNCLPAGLTWPTPAANRVPWKTRTGTCPSPAAVAPPSDCGVSADRRSSVAGVRNLTQVEAAERARLLEVSGYDIALDL